MSGPRLFLILAGLSFLGAVTLAVWKMSMAYNSIIQNNTSETNTTMSESSLNPSEKRILPTRPTQKTVLDNGLTLIVREDASAPVVSVQAWCRTGSIHEEKWVGAGLSHILEHMLFKGTTTRGVGVIARTVDAVGGHMNAYTSFDRTVYHIDAPSSNWKVCLDVLADAVFNSNLPEAEYTKEQEVIRREQAMSQDSPERMAQRLLFETAYVEHPYRYPVIGHADVYNKLSRKDVMDYYKRRYVPNNMAFIIVGDIQFEEVKKRLQELTQPIQRQALPDVFIPVEPRQLGAREDHREFQTELTHLNLGWHIPAISHKDVYALDLLSTILGQGRSSRLNQEVVEKKKLAHSVGAFSYTPGQPGMFIVSAVCQPENRTGTKQAIFEEISRIQEKSVSDVEIQKGRKLYLSGHLQELQTMSGQAADLGTGWMTAHHLDFSEEYLSRVAAVTNEDVRRVAREYLIPQNRTVVSLNPLGTLPAKADAGQRVETSEAKLITLSNGVRVVVRKNGKVPSVSFCAVMKSGPVFETEENSGISHLAAEMLLKGTRRFSAKELADEIENMGGTISADAGLNSAYVSLETLSGDLANGVDMLAEVLIHPTFPPEEVEREKTLQLAALQAEKDQPMAICRNLARRSLFGQVHPYGMNPLGTPETVKKLDAPQVKTFHRQLCVASNLVVGIFGGVDEEQVKPLLEKAFADMPREAIPQMPSIVMPVLAAPLRVGEKIEKAQAVVQIVFPGVSVASPDRFAMQILEAALSDMGSRLFMRIREEQGLAYYVGAAQRMGLFPGHFTFYAGTDPAKADKVVKDLQSEIAKLRESGLTREEVDRAKAKILSAQKMQQQSNAAFAQTCAIDELYGLGFRFYQDYEAALDRVTLLDIAAAAKQYFSPSHHVVVVVKPENKP